MRKYLVFVLPVIFAMNAGCAGMANSLKVNTPFRWEDQKDNFALNAKAGRFYYHNEKVFFAAVDMLEETGFNIKTRDKANGVIETEIWEEMGMSHFQLVADIRDMTQYTAVKWRLFTILPGKRNAFTGVKTEGERSENESPEFKKKTNDRWNYRLYMKLAGKTPVATGEPGAVH